MGKPTTTLCATASSSSSSSSSLGTSLPTSARNSLLSQRVTTAATALASNAECEFTARRRSDDDCDVGVGDSAPRHHHGLLLSVLSLRHVDTRLSFNAGVTWARVAALRVLVCLVRVDSPILTNALDAASSPPDCAATESVLVVERWSLPSTARDQRAFDDQVGSLAAVLPLHARVCEHDSPPLRLRSLGAAVADDRLLDERASTADVAVEFAAHLPGAYRRDLPASLQLCVVVQHLVGAAWQPLLLTDVDEGATLRRSPVHALLKRTSLSDDESDRQSIQQLAESCASDEEADTSSSRPMFLTDEDVADSEPVPPPAPAVVPRLIMRPGTPDPQFESPRRRSMLSKLRASSPPDASDADYQLSPRRGAGDKRAPAALSPFIGSFEASLLAGRMSNAKTNVFQGFSAQLVASGAHFGGEHMRLEFEANYCVVDAESDVALPYVSDVLLPKGGYEVPPKGVVQLTIFNPSRTPIKTFLVPYDVSDMPPSSKTFMRQRIFVTGERDVLKYALHLKICSPRRRRFFLYKYVRVVFPFRQPDANQALSVRFDMPHNPKYFAVTKKV
jgi:hypothetical protein